jgi:iron uptake system component EfeO
MPAAARLALVAVPLLAGCVANAPASGGAGTIAVESTGTECRISSASAPSGTITFRVKNSGDEVTEFYVLGEDGVRVVGEVENIGPGVTRDLVIVAQPGAYVTACKPGMAGDGIQAPFTVAHAGVVASPAGSTP